MEPFIHYGTEVAHFVMHIFQGGKLPNQGFQADVRPDMSALEALH